MSTITIANRNITPGAVRTSQSTTTPDNLSAVAVRLTDPTGNWDTKTGNVLQWGIQIDRQDGNGFVWFVFAAGIPFGTRERDGGLPSLQISSSDLVAAAGFAVQLAIQVDATINLGATITTTPAA